MTSKLHSSDTKMTMMIVVMFLDGNIQPRDYRYHQILMRILENQILGVKMKKQFLPNQVPRGNKQGKGKENVTVQVNGLDRSLKEVIVYREESKVEIKDDDLTPIYTMTKQTKSGGIMIRTNLLGELDPKDRLLPQPLRKRRVDQLPHLLSILKFPELNGSGKRKRRNNIYP